MKVKLLEPLGVSEEYIEKLAKPIVDAGHEFKYYDEKTNDVDELFDRSKDADVVIIANNPFPKEVVKKLENTKLIQVAFTGIDHVAVDEAEEKGIQVDNAAGYSNQSVAEHVIGLTLNILRKISEGDEATRKRATSNGLIGQEIMDKTVGVIGTGKIGYRVCELFNVFGAKLIANSRTEKPEFKELGVEYVDLDTLLKESDIVTIHLPSNKHTRGFLGKDEIAKMKEDAILINCARGAIVDNDALADALNDEKISAAGIDVFDMEPPIPEDYKLLNAKNTLFTPHVAFLTEEAMVRRADIVFDKVVEFLNNK